ncbi:unnamed protein product [Haemonchus placei]|uniref:SCP domain-containing protein n=1 Tax=Haemonchus placei TaxID=6290 RepID=A0A0N4WLZ1_HAEPC|nr:unnamed protein product [Haemonchus placei]
MNLKYLFQRLAIDQPGYRSPRMDTNRGIIDEELLTYGFIPNSIEGSGFSDERSSDQAGTENFACEHSTIALEHRKYILYTHNRLRSKLALGHQPNKPGLGKMGTGRNIYLLRWDCDLELLVHQRIQSCSPHVLMNSSRLSGSQLVKHFDIGLQGHNVSHHIEDSMRTWWLQYKRNGNVDPKNRYSSKQLYYGWANMAKGKTTRIGCSYHRCNANMKAIFSCIYSDSFFLKVLPTNMTVQSYDCELERNAQLWADECVFEHSDRKRRPNQGQNLYMTSFLYLEPTSLLHMAIEMWWKELEEYGIPANAVLSESFWSSKGKLIGHFTQVRSCLTIVQMAWGETHRVGCAVGNCSNMGLVVCHYSPA